MSEQRSKVISYLRQQRQIYGDVLYPVVPIIAPSQQSEISANTLTVSEPMATTSYTSASSLAVLESRICSCMNCVLGGTRNKFVFGSGNPNADIMVIGEAPGADEDDQGLPFVGRAGQLLTKILEAVSLQRDEVYICNILKCRPPNNRKPLTGETETCEPYLHKQIDLIKPRFLLALGLTAANTLLRNKESMTSLRGKIHDYHGIKTIVTYHPAALLRNPDWKKHAWADVQYLRSLYDSK